MRPAWSRSLPKHLGVANRAINNSIAEIRHLLQERWPSVDPFVRPAFFGKYSDFQHQPNADFRNDTNRRRSPFDGIFRTFPARNAELEVSPSKASVKQAWVHRRCPSML